MGKQKTRSRRVGRLNESERYLRAWADEQNEIFAARERILGDPRRKDKLFELAHKGMVASTRTKPATRALLARSALQEQVTVAALTQLALIYAEEYWQGDVFLIKEACAQLEQLVRRGREIGLTILGEELLDSLESLENGSLTARNFRRWAENAEKRAREEGKPTWLVQLQRERRGLQRVQTRQRKAEERAAAETQARQRKAEERVERTLAEALAQANKIDARLE